MQALTQLQQVMQSKMRNKQRVNRQKSIEYLASEITLNQVYQHLKDKFRTSDISQQLIDILINEFGQKKIYTKAEFHDIDAKSTRWMRQFQSPICKFSNRTIITIPITTLPINEFRKSYKENLDTHERILKFIERFQSDIEQVWNTITTEQGFYYLNQYVRNLSKLKQLQIDDNCFMRKLLYHVWNFQFDKAEIQCKNNKNDIQMIFLKSIFKAFKNIELVVSRDRDLDNIFHKSNTFNMGQITEQTYKISPNLNIMCSDLTQQNLKEISALPKQKRVSFVQQTLEYIVSFCNKGINLQGINDYCKAIFIFLGNQVEDNIYREILDLENVHQIDKFFFSKKFLHRNVEYNRVLKEKLELSFNLENLILCARSKEKKMIMQNYLDQTNDLRTIAFLSLHYKANSQKTEIFDSFIEQYKQILLRTDKKILYQQFQSKQKGLIVYQHPSKKLSEHKHIIDNSCFFLKKLDFENKSFLECKKQLTEVPFCTICSAEIKRITDLYVECQKCGHGGHSKHLLRWFETNQRCPKSDCICLCN